MDSVGIPCSHSIRIIANGLKEDPHTYAKTFYILEAFNNTYARAIMHPHNNIDYSQPLKHNSLHPLDHENDLSDNSGSYSKEIVHWDSELNDVLLAPSTHKRIGTPPKKENGLQQLPQKSEVFKGVGDVEQLDTHKGHAQGKLNVLGIQNDVSLSRFEGL